IPAIRSFPPSPRRSRQSLSTGCSSERLAATESPLQVMPVGDLVFTELPAEIHLAAVDQRREVDEPAIDVPEDETRLLARLEEPPHLEERDAALPALVPAAVTGRGPGER